jgi:Predicted ATPase with chaperone activity
MHIEIMPVKFEELMNEKEPGKEYIKGRKQSNSEVMRLEVENARQIQLERYRKEEISYNSQLSAGMIKKYCVMDKETQNLLKEAYNRLALSARAYSKIIKLGRTIADMEGEETIRMKHIAEAIQYRSLDKLYRGRQF